MGIGIVLLLWAAFGTIAAIVGALVLGGATALVTRGVARWRRVAILAACAFPFSCLAWAAAVFAFQAVVNEGFLHRDPGLGDPWHCPIPNGYALLMIDLTDEGWVFNPKTQGVPFSVSEQDDAVAQVRSLQIAGHYILGSSGTRIPGQTHDNSGEVHSYFLLDTAAGKHETFETYERFRGAATQRGIQPKLEPIYQVYSRYRFTWFDGFSLFLFCAPPVMAGGFLIFWVVRLRSRRTSTPTPSM